jgi:PelA/Pel-15E family pectate lyase
MKSRMILFAVGCTLAIVGARAAGAEAQLPVEARAALRRATEALRAIATEGGYLWRYSTDLQQRAGEVIAMPTQIWVQPPGTPAVGMAFLRAHAATKDPYYLAAARAAAQALVRGQLESGGWDYLVEFDTKERSRWAYRVDGPAPAAGVSSTRPRKNISTYDDDNTQSALRFLLAFVDAATSAPAPEDAPVRAALDYGLGKLVEAQYPIGAWPQRWDGQPRDPAAYPVKRASFPAAYPREQPKTSYYQHYTLNDDTHRDAIVTLLDAHKRTGRAGYLEAAKRGGEFLLRAQMPEPQPAWAQQYNAAVEPAWARAFEPPAITAGESVGVLRQLVDLYLELGDERYLKPLPAAIAWYERSKLGAGRWARLYELQTNRPLYGDRDGKIHYTLEEITEERRTGYSWQGDYGIPAAIDHARAVMQAGRERWRADHANRPPTPAQAATRARRLESRVREIVGRLDAQGRWLSDFAGKNLDRNAGPWIDTQVFIINVRTLCDYLELAGR